MGLIYMISLSIKFFKDCNLLIQNSDVLYNDPFIDKTWNCSIN